MVTDQVGVSASLRVLGEISVDAGGVAVTLPDSMRAVALLGWLAIHSGSRSRSEIAAALWPDVPDSAARSSVRTALWALRRAFGEHAEAVLDTSRNRIGLRNVEVDLARFVELVADDRLDEALAMSSGELLAGLDDEWAMLARESHRDLVITLLRDQSDKAAANGDLAVAVEGARHAAELNPLSETCARLLMCRYDEAGDCSLALAVYARIVDRLRHELRIAPADETWQLAEKIRSRQQSQRPTVHTSRQLRRLATTPLVGRDPELQSLGKAWRLARSGAGGVAIVHGEAGIGKTRLVAELIELAGHTGALTALGTTSTVGCPPYWPWSELGAALLRGLGGVPDGEAFTTAATATGSTVGPETIDASNGILPFFQDTSGYQEFNIYDTTVGTPAVPDVVGTDDFLRSDWTSGSLSNTQYTLDATEFGGGGMVFTGAPDPGSVYDTLNLGAGLENVYTDVLTGTGTSITSTVTDNLVFNGTELLNLSSLVSGLGLDFAVPATDAFLSF